MISVVKTGQLKRFAICVILCTGLFFSSVSVSSARELIFVLKSLEITPYEVALKGLKKELRENGYNVKIQEHLLNEDNKEKAEFVKAIANKNPRLIVTLGSGATAYVAKAIKDIPVVFCMVLNPVDSGLIQSMTASGNNLTGASLDIPLRVQFEALRSVIPSARTVGVIYNPRETERVIRRATDVAQEVGFTMVSIPIVSEEEVPKALRTLDGKIDALWSVADSTVFSSGSAEFILLHTLRNRIPFMGLSPAFVKAGALMALAANYEEIGTQCGQLTTRILAGDEPSALPITTPKRTTIYLNLKTAETIGLKIPSPAMKGAVLIR